MSMDFDNIFDLSAPVIYFPLRHHSPACAYHLIKVINEYAPDCILIEGPSDADHLIKYLGNDGVVPPVCIYSSFDDRNAAVSDDKEKYRAYYPFLAYSPEYAAVKEAVRKNIPTHFIDMPYAMQLVKFGAKERMHKFTEDNGAEYYARTAEKSGCRSFAEFWERGFETAFAADTRDFVKSVYMLGKYMRQLSPSDERNDCREAFMRREIEGYKKSYSRIIVIAGAYHIDGLTEKGKKITFPRYHKADCGHYLMPYSFAETDSRSGYGAGIPFPGFYSAVWKRLITNSPAPFEETAENFIIKTARYARTKQPVALPDETEALYMANSLAALRGKPSLGAFELIDGVRSAFVKGDINTTAAFELDFLFRLMTGLGAGEINIPDDGTEQIIPPCVADFRAICKKFRINTGTIVRQKTTLDVIKNPLHFEKSCFFHRMEFLQTGFCKLESGPDYANDTDTSLIREVWSYRFSTAAESKLIDLSVSGGSVSAICRSLLTERFADIKSAGDTGKFMLSTYVMGFSEMASQFISDAFDIVRSDTDFLSQCLFMSFAARLLTLQKLSEGKYSQPLCELLKISFQTAAYRITEVCQSAGSSENGICSGIRMMYSISGTFPNECDRHLLLQQVSEASDSTQTTPQIYGVCLAICAKAKVISENEYCDNIKAYLLSADGDGCAGFIEGIISTGRDVIFTSSAVLQSIDNAFSRMDREHFMAVLPRLRRSFTAFLPAETARISRSIAELYGVSDNKLHGSISFTAEDIIRCGECDRKIRDNMKKWGLM
ncbi:MAG: hypothetical protein IJ368_07720 [Oscillospiraceae bacterium]|nr:hypothetical protein [Oscillospiraceae bacterium]